MLAKLAQWLLKVTGWKIVGQLPEIDKYILIAAPHTSNWDLVVGIVARTSLAKRIQFLAKHQLFVFPLAWFFRMLGGIPVERTKHHNLVDAVVEMYNTSDKLILGLAPEGTRSPVKRWKQGFYHIARLANVPIVMVGFDYPSGELRVSEPFYPTGDINKDFPKILDYYRTINGRHPKEIPQFEPQNEDKSC